MDSVSDAALAAVIEAKVKRAGTSFYWGMRMLPPERRAGMYAVYAFCREVDDIADEDGMELSERQHQLQEWRDEIDRIYAGAAPTMLVSRALVPLIQPYHLRREDFIAVIDGCAMDGEGTVTRPSIQTLDLYVDRVACAVGRLSVRLFGPFTPRCDDVAFSLGRALQLTNILRDVAEDASIGRLYLPDELLTAYGITAPDLGDVLAHPALPLVLRDLGTIARHHFVRAAEAMAECPKDTMRPAALMRASYLGILDRLEARSWPVHGPRAGLSAPQKLWYALRFGFFRG